MKYKILVLFLASSFLYAPEKVSLIKPRTKRIQKSTGDIKQAIAQECDFLLTSCLSSINSLTECIHVVRNKLKALLSGNDSFYSKQKAKQLEKYKEKLQEMRKVFEQIETKLDKEIENLDTNFSK